MLRGIGAQGALRDAGFVDLGQGLPHTVVYRDQEGLGRAGLGMGGGVRKYRFVNFVGMHLPEDRIPPQSGQDMVTSRRMASRRRPQSQGE